jgi:hypothetical protein
MRNWGGPPLEGPSFAAGPGGEVLAETKDAAEQMLLVDVG